LRCKVGGDKTCLFSYLVYDRKLREKGVFLGVSLLGPTNHPQTIEKIKRKKSSWMRMMQMPFY